VLEKFFSQKIENSELEIKILNLIKFYISSKVENNVSKFSHIIAKCFNNLVFSIKKLIELSTKSKFKPNDFEFKFSQCMEFHKIKLSVILEGKIDRIDVFKDKNYFLRVIDYKSGNKKFNLVEIMNGINIQLIVYLIVLKFNEKYKKFKPTGALYFSTKKPTINKLINESNESLNNRLSKLTFMQGFTIDSEPLNTEINIDQLTEEEMNVILEYSKFLISNMVEKLMNADITPKPVVISNCKTSCDICDYKNMCQKDINIKILETKLKKEEVIQNMIAAIGSKIKFLRIKHNK
ncbi:MAG: PD-(D/E)XK nuclease family protein, partial [Firmicutes bacterium]|nr:PD-(D/E)XK nuclease family protein [Bacillota bacterium]